MQLRIKLNVTNTVFDAKRMIGRRFSDPTIQNDMKHWSFKVCDDGHDKPIIEVQYKGETKRFTPEEISSMVLTKMKRNMVSKNLFFYVQKFGKKMKKIPLFFRS